MTDAFKAGNVYKLQHNGRWATFLLSDALMATYESGALEQLRATMEMPGVDAVYVQPDSHRGYGVPIGVAVYSKTHIYPDICGPDPSCAVGLSYVNLELPDMDKPDKREVLDKIQTVVGIDRIDTGFTEEELFSVLRGEKRPHNAWLTHAPLEGDDPVFPLIKSLLNTRMLRHRATIGEGNHFTELGVSGKGNTYILSHFGSRGIGAAGARYFDSRVRGEMAAWGLPVTKNSLVWMPEGSEIGRLYMSFQRAMLEFTAYNHHYVHQAISDKLEVVMNFQGFIPHNFIEEKDGYLVGRKGATPAYEFNGLPLLVPGTMSTGSYVLSPGSNAPRYGESVAHGAGRVLGRRAAKEALSQEDVDNAFNDAGLMGNFRNVPIDESAGAYKDIDLVVESLVDTGVAVIRDRLNPHMIVKG